MKLEIEDYDLNSSGITLPVVYIADGEVHNMDILLDNLFEHLQQTGWVEFYNPAKQQVVTRFEDYRFNYFTGEVEEVTGKCNVYSYKEWLRECAPMDEILTSFLTSKIFQL
jgi:hypothetical protein